MVSWVKRAWAWVGDHWWVVLLFPAVVVVDIFVRLTGKPKVELVDPVLAADTRQAQQQQQLQQELRGQQQLETRKLRQVDQQQTQQLQQFTKEQRQQYKRLQQDPQALNEWLHRISKN
jgi:hypothetical protein